MRSRLVILCLGFLSLCGLALAQSSAGPGASSRAMTWKSGLDPDDGVVTVTFAHQKNIPGRCDLLTLTPITYCTNLPPNCDLITVSVPFVCKPAAVQCACKGGSAMTALTVQVLPAPCTVLTRNGVSWCFQRGAGC